MTKPRLLYLLAHYPQPSETYVLSEIDVLGHEYDIRVIGRQEPELRCRANAPHEMIVEEEAVVARVEELRPQILHSHWLMNANNVAAVAERTGIPFTIRTHSFDVLPWPESVEPYADAVNGDACLGILAFPFKRPILEQYGISPSKIVDCWPVINYERFHDRSPNEPGVMNLGVATPKKQMEGFLLLATLVKEKPFRLYAMAAFDREELVVKNEEMGSPVEIVPPIEPPEMPAEYKRHDWLVYTASFGMNSVGWPMAVAEARAAGLGVAVPNLRPDMQEYAGPGAILYDSIEEVADVVSGPVPEDTREAGFEHAKKSDIKRHISLLTDLWERRAAGVA